MPEWSKGHDSSSCGFGRVGSNPTRSTFFVLELLFSACFYRRFLFRLFGGFAGAWDVQGVGFASLELFDAWDVRGAWDVGDGLGCAWCVGCA